MARRSAHAGRGPSQRQLRVGEEIRHVLAELLTRGGLREPALADARLTISEVRVSADLRHAEETRGGAQAAERLEGSAEQHGRQRLLMRADETTELTRDREHDMEVRHGQQKLPLLSSQRVVASNPHRGQAQCGHE